MYEQVRTFLGVAGQYAGGYKGRCCVPVFGRDVAE